MASLLLALAPLPRLAQATCSFANRTGMTRVIFTTPGQITIPDNVAPGTVLWTSPMVAQQSNVDVNCDQRTTGGIVNFLGTQPAGGSNTFPTNIPGLAIRLARGGAGAYLGAPPADYLDSGTTTFSKTTSLELVATGPIANGSTLSAGQLAHWDFGNLSSIVVFQTANATVFTRPACTIAIDPTTVTLRAVTSSELQGGNGTTAADTPFAIQLSCTSATALDITLDANNPVNKNTGVLSNIAGGASAAKGVAVQITDQDGTPVKLQKAIRVNTSSGPFPIPFAARYYRTNGTLSPGLVNATATYTVTYP
jgi:type 1 fimbria pilin